MTSRWFVVSLCALVGCGGSSDARIEALQARIEQLEAKPLAGEIILRQITIVDDSGSRCATLSADGLKMWREGDEYAKCVLSAQRSLFGLTIRDTDRSIKLTMSSDEVERTTLLLEAGQTAALMQANSKQSRLDLRNTSAQSEITVHPNRSVLSVEGDGGNSAFTLKAQSGRPEIMTLPIQ